MTDSRGNFEPGHRWRVLGDLLHRRSLVVLIVAAVVAAITAVGLSQLAFATGQDSYLESDSQIAIDNERYQELFGGENMVVLFTLDEGSTVVDLFTSGNIEKFEAITSELHANESIDAVISPLTAASWTENIILSGAATEILGGAIEREPDPAAAQIRAADGGMTLQRLTSAGVPGFENPDWVRFLLFDNTGFTIDADGVVVAPPESELQIRKALQSFFPDSQHALLAATVQGNADLDELAQGSEAVAGALEGRTFDNASFVVTGTPTFLTDINDYLQSGMLTLGAIALVVMLVVLAVAFPVRWRLLPLLSVVVGIVWGFGVFGYLGIGLSLVTISGLPILIGIGIDFAIQVHSRVEEQCAADDDSSPFATTMALLGPPLLIATIAAVIAFMVMQISKVPMIRDFGVLLSIGIIALLVAGVAIPFSVLGARERRGGSEHGFSPGRIGNIVSRMGAAPKTLIPVFVAAAVVLPIVGLVLEADADIESDPINWADPGSDSVVNARMVEDEVGFATTMGVFIETDGAESNGIFTDEMAAFVHDAALGSLAEEASLVQASSLVTTVSYLMEIPGTTSLPPTGSDLLAAYNVAPPDIQRLLVGPDGNTAQILFRVGPSSLDQRALLIDRIEASLASPGDRAAMPGDASATVAGLARVGVGLLDNLQANRSALTIAALLLVGSWLLLRSASLTQMALTMIPILLAVGASATVVSLLGITLSPLTTVGGPLVIATCAEFSVLLVARYREARRGGLEPTEASTTASQHTGRAFTASALTTIGGFAVLMFAPLPLLSDFGAVVTLNIAIALLSALIVVPPLVVWADRRRWFVADAVPNVRPALTGGFAAAGAGFVVLLVAGGVLVGSSLQDDAVEAAVPVTVPAGVPATTAAPTTAPPTTAAPTTAPVVENTSPTTTPDSTEPPETTVPTATTLPPGPAERPGGIVGGVLYDTFVGAGVDAGVARCAADRLVEVTPEAELLGMGIAADPRPAEVNALIATAAQECGVPAEVLAALAG